MCKGYPKTIRLDMDQVETVEACFPSGVSLRRMSQRQDIDKRNDFTPSGVKAVFSSISMSRERQATPDMGVGFESNLDTDNTFRGRSPSPYRGPGTGLLR